LFFKNNVPFEEKILINMLYLNFIGCTKQAQYERIIIYSKIQHSIKLMLGMQQTIWGQNGTPRT